MRSTTEKVTYQYDENNVVVNAETGEVEQQLKTTHKVTRLETEPPYVKLYLDCLSKFKNMQLSFNPILNEFLKRSTYADPDDITGGQVIYCTKLMKSVIANKCGVGYKRVEQALTEFVKKGILSRIGAGTYQVNPYLFGKGEWKDIKQIRATFDFNTGEAVADIVKGEEETLTEVAERLDEEYEKSKPAQAVQAEPTTSPTAMVAEPSQEFVGQQMMF